MASNKINTTAGKFDVQMAQCVVVNEIDKELLNFRVCSVDTSDDFPSVGDVGCIYKANKESRLYQWDEEKQTYTPLGSSSTSIENLQTIVTDLQTNVTNLQTIIGSDTQDADTLVTRISKLENGVDILNGDENTDGSILQMIKEEINTFATNVTDDGVVNSYKELIDYVADHGAETATMIDDITSLKQLVGNKSVAEQIDEAVNDISGNKFTDTLLDKLNNIEPEAQVNKIEKIDIDGFSVDITDKTAKIPIATTGNAGVVKSSTGLNKVNISNDGTMSVNKVDINNIFIPIGDELVLGGGDALSTITTYSAKIGNIGYENIVDAIKYADNGDIITLQGDINMGDDDDDHLVVNAENITINLDNNTFIANGSMGAIKIESGTTTFGGTGVISGTLGSDDYSMAIWATGGKVVINGGTYRNETDGTERGTDLIYASSNGYIEINGGVFEAAKPEWTLNCRDADYKAGKAKIVVKGGSFKNFDPANNKAEGLNTNFVADGYKSVKNGDYYIVTPA